MAVCGRSGCGKLSFGAVGQVRCVTVLFVTFWCGMLRQARYGY